MIDLFSNIHADDVYLVIASLIGLVVMYMLVQSFLHDQRFAGRVKSLQERRAQLKMQMINPRRRSKKTGPHVSLGVIRLVVSKMNLLQKSQVGKITALLINAGYRSKDAIYIFAFFQLVCPLVATGVALLAVDFNFADPFATLWKPFIITLCAFVGLKLPSIIVTNKRNKRYHIVQKGLSDTLDLMMICAEAGLSLAAALDRVANELAKTYPELSEELGLTSIELGFLPDRKKALTNLAERVNIPEVRGIVGVLIQTEKYGTPIAQALRTLAAEFREQRMLRAEQKAARLPAIMTVPMIIFILPTLFVVIIAPALIKLLVINK